MSIFKCCGGRPPKKNRKDQMTAPDQQANALKPPIKPASASAPTASVKPPTEPESTPVASTPVSLRQLRKVQINTINEIRHVLLNQDQAEGIQMAAQFFDETFSYTEEITKAVRQEYGTVDDQKVQKVKAKFENFEETIRLLNLHTQSYNRPGKITTDRFGRMYDITDETLPSQIIQFDFSRVLALTIRHNS